MDHEEAVARFPELVRGDLADDARADLERHLKGCDECTRLAETYAEVDRAMRTPHPSAEVIVDFAVRELPDAERQSVRTHVEACPTCADEVERTRQAESRVERQSAAGASSPRRGRSRLAGLAAMAAGLLLIIMAFDDVRLRRLLGGPGHDEGGVVELKVLTSAARGEQAPETIRVGAGQSFVPLALQIDRVATTPGEGELRFEIRDSAADVIWVRTLPRSEVTETIRETGIVTFLVPATLLEPARYTMRVRPAAPAEAPALLDVPFEIRND